MKLHLQTTQLHLKETFTISRDSYSSKEIVIVSLNDKNKTGYGEACEHVYYQVKIKNLVAILEKLRPKIEAFQFGHPEELWELLHPDLEKHSFAQCALDVAAWDLFGKINNQPLYQLWGLEYNNTPITDYTIGIDSIEKMLKKIKDFPFPVYKIKLGTEHDMDIMRAIRANTSARLQIDANCGWTADQTIEYAKELKRLDVELIEQPLQSNDWEGMKAVFKYSVLPVYADEACVRESDVEKCADYFHGINIKLMKCGGITPALRMIHQAKKLGLKLMMGCMTEASIGISAIAHFLPYLDYVDMDGALLVSDDPASGVVINADGTVSFPDVAGTGVSLL
ncbi:MAG TPA: dipeptide epimerase [Saprospiraceae bacterium]|nr:dipeptide epimerase [Saprospiraceae bacterium]